MAKIGKYSTGLSGSAKTAPSPYGQSNKGYEAKSSLMGEMAKSAPMGLTRHTATGNKTLIKKG